MFKVANKIDQFAAWGDKSALNNGVFWAFWVGVVGISLWLVGITI